MALVSRTHSKLLTSGFLPSKQNTDYERWIDTRGKGAAISFFKSDKKVDVFRVDGPNPDRPEVDEFESYYTQNLSEAIRVSRI